MIVWYVLGGRNHTEFSTCADDFSVTLTLRIAQVLGRNGPYAANRSRSTDRGTYNLLPRLHGSSGVPTLSQYASIGWDGSDLRSANSLELSGSVAGSLQEMHKYSTEMRSVDFHYVDDEVSLEWMSELSS